MLIELSIRNVALIEALTLEFGKGFNVLTGETGAGKSIVVDSLSMALGGRADRDLIRTGTDRAVVQAVFDISGNARAIALARELGAEADEGLVAVSRELRANGRNICRVSGIVVPLATLKQLTSLLVDIHGQHEHQALIHPARHRDFLDAFGDADHRALLENVAALHGRRARVAGEYRRVTAAGAERERLKDMLEFQWSEISALHLKRGEEEKLEKRARFMENAEKIQTAVETASALINGGREAGAQEQLDQAARLLESAGTGDERMEALLSRTKDAFYQVQDLGYELRALSESLDFDPAAADRVHDRLDKIRRLERKYGATVDEVIDFGENVRRKLSEIGAGNEDAAALKAEYLKLDGQLKEACSQLTQSRQKIAAFLTEGMHGQLADLGMGRTRFQVRITPVKPTSAGADDVEFLISANPGEPLKPMASVASGGELSRIMLALKAMAVDAGGVDSMVFDEIDTGVSGRMAQAVGEKMKLIARTHQVLCVTHLPQIAALGDVHFVVEKTTDGARTDSIVRPLDAEGRVLEISRLIGGGEDSETSLSHARHLLGMD